MHYVDLVKQSRPPGSPRAPWDGNCSVDAAGWPTQDFGLILITDDSGPPPPVGTGTHIEGVYLISATGNASLSFSGSTGSFLNQSYSAESNTLLAFFNVTASGNFWVSFEGTQREPGNPAAGAGLTNVVALQPGYSPRGVRRGGLRRAAPVDQPPRVGARGLPRGGSPLPRPPGLLAQR